MNKFIKTNINNYIYFKPTPLAFEFYRNYISELLQGCLPEVSRELKVNKYGFCKMQIWDCFHIFGEKLGMGKELIMETEVFVECPTPETYTVFDA